jgi:hypothetical protein
MLRLGFESRRRRFWIVLAGVAAAGAAVALVMATGSSGTGGGGTTKKTYFQQFGVSASGASARALAQSTPPQATTPPAQARRARRQARKRPPLKGHPGAPQPGEILSHKETDGYFPTVVLWPLKNQWQASDRRRYTAVDAGADASKPSNGLFGIYRHNYIRVKETEKAVKVRGAGALKITKAPLGPSAETWAQKHGNIQFKGQKGVTGTLHLADDTVTVNP